MPRPPRAPERASVASGELEAYDAAFARATVMRDDRSGGEIRPYFAALLTSPPMAAALMDLGRIVRTRGEAPGSYSHSDREWADQVLSALLRTNVVQRLHLPDALAVGVRAEAIAALRAGRDEDLTADELLLARYIRAVVTGTVTDDLYAAIEERMSDRGAVEYTLFITFLLQTMRNFQALGMEDPDDAEIDALLDDYRAGRLTPPDPRVRFR